MEAAELSLATLVEIEISEKCPPLLDVTPRCAQHGPGPASHKAASFHESLGGKRAHSVILKSTGYRNVPVCTVTLLKIGARVRISARRIHVAMSGSCPDRTSIAAAWKALVPI